jgi:hypothetical protein
MAFIEAPKPVFGEIVRDGDKTASIWVEFAADFSGPRAPKLGSELCFPRAFREAILDAIDPARKWWAVAPPFRDKTCETGGAPCLY